MSYPEVTCSLKIIQQTLKRLNVSTAEGHVEAREAAGRLAEELKELLACEDERFIRQVVQHIDYFRTECAQFDLVLPLHTFWEKWLKWKMEEISNSGEFTRLEDIILAFQYLAASEVMWPAAVKILSEWKRATGLAELIVFSGVASHALSHPSLWEINLSGWPDPIRNEAINATFLPLREIRDKANRLEQEWQPKERTAERLLKAYIVEELREELSKRIAPE